VEWHDDQYQGAAPFSSGTPYLCPHPMLHDDHHWYYEWALEEEYMTIHEDAIENTMILTDKYNQ
jgi:hypothetical protein